MIVELLLSVSTLILGVFVGAQLTEAVLFVPYWKTLSPDDFFDLHKSYYKKLHAFYAPLTIVATILPIVTVAYGLYFHIGYEIIFGILGASTLAFFSSYFIYFKKANKKFTNRSIKNENLSRELRKWGAWHWGRVVFEFIAFVSAIVLICKF